MFILNRLVKTWRDPESFSNCHSFCTKIYCKTYRNNPKSTNPNM